MIYVPITKSLMILAVDCQVFGIEGTGCGSGLTSADPSSIIDTKSARNTSPVL